MAYLFFCTATSGTASMLRIIRTIAGPGMILREIGDVMGFTPEAGKGFIDRSRSDTISWIRNPKFWDPALDLSGIGLIGHFRDPRDLACNQYWWALQHPNLTDSPELAAARLAKIEAGGIDKYAVNRNNNNAFRMMSSVSDGPLGDTATWTSYSQLCCAFDYLMDGLCKRFGRAPSEVAEALRIERPENLGGNPDWVKVGGTWKGSDITPGRFRRELRPESVAEITRRNAHLLAYCRQRDAGFLEHHYL